MFEFPYTALKENDLVRSDSYMGNTKASEKKSDGCTGLVGGSACWDEAYIQVCLCTDPEESRRVQE